MIGAMDTMLMLCVSGAIAISPPATPASAVMSGSRVASSEPNATNSTIAAATRGLIARYLTLDDRAPQAPPGLVDALTEREREIVALVATGMSNAEIADHLTLSPLTVKTHANHAMTKLGARDRAQLVVLAYQAGLAAGSSRSYPFAGMTRLSRSSG